MIKIGPDLNNITHKILRKLKCFLGIHDYLINHLGTFVVFLKCHHCKNLTVDGKTKYEERIKQTKRNKIDNTEIRAVLIEKNLKFTYAKIIHLHDAISFVKLSKSEH